MTSNSNPSFDIFISYTSKSALTNKTQIQRLCKRLTTEYNFKVWIDLEQLNITSVSKAITEGMRNSKIVLCCITKVYSQLQENQSELAIANELKKPLIVFMLEDLKLIDISEISLYIGHARSFNIFYDQRGLKSWSGRIFDDVIKQIKLFIDAFDKKGQNKVQNEKHAAASQMNTVRQDENSTFSLKLPLANKSFLKKCSDFMKLRHTCDEIEQKSQIENASEIDAFIETILRENTNITEEEKQEVKEIKKIRSNEHKVFHIEANVNDCSKITLFVVKRKSNGKYQIFSCSNRKPLEISDAKSVFNSFFNVKYNNRTSEFFDNIFPQANTSCMKSLILQTLVEEMIEYDLHISIDWESDLNLDSSIGKRVNRRESLKTASTSTENDSFKPIRINKTKVSVNIPSIVIKFPVSTKLFIERCIELTSSLFVKNVSRLIKFEKLVIDIYDLDNFVDTLMKKYPYITDNEKHNIEQIRSLKENEYKYLYLETQHFEAIKISLYIIKRDNDGRFNVLFSENRKFASVSEIGLMFINLFDLSDSLDTDEFIGKVKDLQSTKKLNKLFLKHFLATQISKHFSEIVDIEWENDGHREIQLSQTKPKIKEKTVEKESDSNRQQQQSISIQNSMNISIQNEDVANTSTKQESRNLSSVPHLNLPNKTKKFVKKCEDFIQTMGFNSIYQTLEFKTTNLKSSSIGKYMDILLDEYLFATEEEKCELCSVRDMNNGEKKCMFIETTTHDSSKFILYLFKREANGKYQIFSCADEQYVDLTEFHRLFKKLYNVNNEPETLTFLREMDSLANKSSVKSFLLNFLVLKLNENFNETIEIQWI